MDIGAGAGVGLYVTKMKKRENARKNRLKKKLHTAALEESLRNLGRILKHLRDLILGTGVTVVNGL
jgi:hypothetical protein